MYDIKDYVSDGYSAFVAACNLFKPFDPTVASNYLNFDLNTSAIRNVEYDQSSIADSSKTGVVLCGNFRRNKHSGIKE